MVALSVILVMCSGLAHAVWNLFAKSSEDKAVFLWCIFMPTTVLLLPVLLGEAVGAHYSPGVWGMLLLSAALQSFYAWLLAHTYRMGDLSVVYPIMRGTSTLLIPLLGAGFLGERLPSMAWAGIGLMLLGFAFMGRNASVLPRGSAISVPGSSVHPVLMALGVGLTITCYTLVDKWNLQHITPLSLLEVTNIGFVLGLTPQVLKRRGVIRLIRSRWRTMLLGAVLSPGSYLLFLFAVRHVQVASTAPLREIGIVFGTFLGITVLKEGFPARRFAASAIVLSGILLIAFNR